MATITVGRTTNTSVSGNNLWTILNMSAVANADGVIKSVTIYSSGNNGTCKVGVFYGSGNSWTVRSQASIGPLNFNATTTATVNLPVKSGDVIGYYVNQSGIYGQVVGGGASYYYIGDGFDGSAHTYTSDTVGYYNIGTGDTWAISYKFRPGSLGSMLG